MTAEEFRSEMIIRIRGFDSWAYKDQLQNPADYSNFEFSDWFDMFNDYMEQKYG